MSSSCGPLVGVVRCMAPDALHVRGEVRQAPFAAVTTAIKRRAAHTCGEAHPQGAHESVRFVLACHHRLSLGCLHMLQRLAALMRVTSTSPSCILRPGPAQGPARRCNSKHVQHLAVQNIQDAQSTQNAGERTARQGPHKRPCRARHCLTCQPLKWGGGCSPALAHASGASVAAPAAACSCACSRAAASCCALAASPSPAAAAGACGLGCASAGLFWLVPVRS